MNGQLHAPAALPPGKEPPVPIWYEVGWAPEPGWTLWRREESCPYQESNPGRPVCSRSPYRLISVGSAVTNICQYPKEVMGHKFFPKLGPFQFSSPCDRKCKWADTERSVRPVIVSFCSEGDWYNQFEVLTAVVAESTGMYRRVVRLTL
jgi:hypothetical protein